LLLDTNALIWSLAKPDRLSTKAREAICAETSRVFVSAVSAWEIGVKQAKGLLELPQDLESHMLENRFDPLPLTFDQALAIEALPYKHHDPFDRMIVAQAQAEELVLVTSDREMRRYEVAILPAI
jgi:PIN domain nuclease of toxin-antitoxin system